MTRLSHIDQQGIKRNHFLTAATYSPDEASMQLPNFKEIADSGINAGSLTELSTALRGIIYSIEFPGEVNTLFDGLDKDALTAIGAAIERHWKKQEWQYAGEDDIYFHYFNSDTYFLPPDFTDINYWHYDEQKNQANTQDGEGGRFYLSLSKEEWDNAVEDDCIADYMEDMDDIEHWGYFYSEAEETEMKYKLVAILHAVNRVIEKWNPRYTIKLHHT